jgi:hypothetical protein
VRPPYESEFNEVEGRVECPYGLIGVRFRREKGGGTVVLDLTVPISTTATVHLPETCGNVEVTRAGSRHLEVQHEGKSVQLCHGTYVLKIDSGS